MSIIIFILIVCILILVHEFGHFIVAKKFGIRVDEFGIGFPPRAVKLFKKGETEYTLNWIPFGGFVKIFGENPVENEDGVDSERNFSRKPRLVQAAVLFAGVFFNLLFAWALLSIGFMVGLPTTVSSVPAESLSGNIPELTITSVTEGSPADLAGLLPGDVILAVGSGNNQIAKDLDGQTVMDVISMSSEDKPLELTYIRNDIEKEVEIVPSTESSDRPIIGVTMDSIVEVKFSFFKSIWQGAKTTVFMFWETAKSLGNLLVDSVRGRADLSTIAGPIGIAGIAGDAYDFGWVYLLFFVSLISINLAVINLIPFPALDGGRLFIILVEAITRRKIKPNIFALINTVGFILLILLMVVITFNDIRNIL